MGFWWVRESAGPRIATLFSARGTSGEADSSLGPRIAILFSARGTVGKADFTQETFCNASMAILKRVA